MKKLKLFKSGQRRQKLMRKAAEYYSDQWGLVMPILQIKCYRRKLMRKINIKWRRERNNPSGGILQVV